jgi:anti-sigma B factor antagonist
VSVNALPIDTDCEELAEGSFVIRVRGEVDMATSPLLRRALDECIASDPDRVIVEMSEVTFIDATGLRTLNEFDVGIRAGGGELLVSRPSWQVRRVLETARLRCRLRIAPD